LGRGERIGRHAIDKYGEKIREAEVENPNDTQSLLKLKSRRRDCIYFQLNRSKAFERSSLMSILGVLVDVRELITSCINMTLSIIWCPST